MNLAVKFYWRWEIKLVDSVIIRGLAKNLNKEIAFTQTFLTNKKVDLFCYIISGILYTIWILIYCYIFLFIVFICFLNTSTRFIPNSLLSSGNRWKPFLFYYMILSFVQTEESQNIGTYHAAHKWCCMYKPLASQHIGHLRVFNHTIVKRQPPNFIVWGQIITYFVNCQLIR